MRVYSCSPLNFPKAHTLNLRSGENKVLPARIWGITRSKRTELFVKACMLLFSGVNPQFANEDTAVKMAKVHILISLLCRTCLASELSQK